MSRDAPFIVGGPSNVLSFAPLQEQIGRLLDDFSQGFPRSRSREGSFEFAPCMEVLETAADVLINIELPGVLLNDIALVATAHSVVVSGQKRSVVHTDEGEKYCSNREFGAFSQTFSLSSPIDPDRVTAQLNAGLLAIRVPKSAKLVMPARTIPITS